MSIRDCHIIKVDTQDIANGPGIRVSVWVSGCLHRCPECHNPDTWKWKQGMTLSPSLINSIIDACKQPHIKGLTVTGGDPFFPKNREGLFELLLYFETAFKGTKDVWVWTGYQYEDLKDLPHLAFITTLIDGKYIKELKDVSLPYSGSSNQRVINIKELHE